MEHDGGSGYDWRHHLACGDCRPCSSRHLALESNKEIIFSMFLDKLFRRKKSGDKKEELKELIKQGILYEDEFIVMYAKLLKSERFSAFFKDRQERTKEILNILMVESEGHKRGLERVIDNLK